MNPTVNDLDIWALIGPAAVKRLSHDTDDINSRALQNLLTLRSITSGKTGGVFTV